MEHTIVYSAKKITIDNATTLSGQFYSEERIEIRGGSHIEYPSVALVFAKSPDNGINLLQNTT